MSISAHHEDGMPIRNSHTSSDRFAAHPAGSGDTPRASHRRNRGRSQETKMRCFALSFAFPLGKVGTGTDLGLRPSSKGVSGAPQMQTARGKR